MSWQRLRLIFLREIRDQLRDRRTLFMIAVLPLLLYPALGIGVMQMTLLLQDEPQTVLVLNAEALPDPPLIQGDQFAKRWTESSREPARLRVITPKTLDESNQTKEADASLAHRLTELQKAYRRARDRREGMEEASADPQSIERLDEKLARLGQRRQALLEESGIQVVLIVPPDLGSRFGTIVDQYRAEPDSFDPADFPTPEILYSAAGEKGRIAFGRVENVYQRWKNAALARQLEQAGLPPKFAQLLDADVVDIAGRQDYAESIWSRILPGLLVLMTLTGAFYPAIDLVAGEKERGTMETLLICPARRLEIVGGKFLTIVSFAVATAILNLVSLGLTGQYIASAALADGTGVDAVRGLLLPSFVSLIWVGVLLVPIAALFSAMCLAVATFARGTKEGQYYLTPILLVTVGLTMFAQMPTVNLSPLNSVIPVSGVVLLLKSFLGGEAPYAYLVPILLTSFGYAAIAIWWAAEQFQREDVLFREAEAFEPRLWLGKLWRDRGEVPGVGAAGFCFLVIMLLQFGAIRFFAGGLLPGSNDAPGVTTAKLLILQQFALIAAPALLLGFLLTTSPRATFRIRLPPMSYLLIGLVLPLALMPLSATLAELTAPLFPDLPPSVARLMELMATDEIPLPLLLGAFALAPAICEELAFRGFILSGVLGRRRQWAAIVVTSFLFGLMHMIPQQAFNAALLGLVLGLLAVRSRSLWPCMIFHFMFNGVSLLQQRYSENVFAEGYPWWLLLPCLLVSGALIAWLVTRSSRPRVRREEEVPKSILSTPVEQSS